MAKGVTTSIRLDPDLRDQLEHASQVMHRGKNWIIIHALQKFLSDIETLELAKEAKRQSLLAARADKAQEQEDDWEDMGDTSGWK
jgi:predicted DNA-binding protein